MNEDQAREFVAARGSLAALSSLERFHTRLIAGSTEQNLISSSTLNLIWSRHFADSAQILDHVSRETRSLLDLGSGAGLPGIVIAILRPDISIILVESRKLRIKWLEDVAAEFDCANVRVAGVPVINVPDQSVDAITARAFAPLGKLLRLAGRFSTPDTDWVLPKGRSAAQEVSALPQGLRSMFHVKRSVTDADAGIIVGRGRVKFTP